MEAIAPEQIRAHVGKFWELFSGKDKRNFAQLYAPMATVFAMDARRSEPARLMLVRRERELFAPTSEVRARCGEITVQVLSANIATASYSLYFSVTRVIPNGSTTHVDVPYGRVTQVFHLNESGGLLIIHEHMSSAEPTVTKTLEAKAAHGTRP